MGALGITLYEQGDLRGAERHLAPALAGLRSKLGDRHPTTLNCMRALATTLREAGNTEASTPLFTELSAASLASNKASNAFEAALVVQVLSTRFFGRSYAWAAEVKARQAKYALKR